MALQPYIGGANGFGLEKDSKAAAAETAEAPNNLKCKDVRPVCSGDVWRRVVGKSLLSTESSNLESHFFPYQLAVAVRSGTECMPHLARQWLTQHQGDTDRILVDFDESNAHNTVDRHTFLQRAHQVIPGVSRWLEYIYPTDVATFVFYRGRCIESRAGGQQGCPLMAVGHALVQRILLGSLRVIELDSRTTEIAPLIASRPALDMTPGFADDGFLAGPSSAVRESLQHIQSFMPALGLSFSRLEVVPAAGDRCTVDFDAFLASVARYQVRQMSPS